VGNVEVLSVKDFESVVAKFDKSKALSVLFRRGEWTQYAILKASK
jgi:serine protease Do